MGTPFLCRENDGLFEIKECYNEKTAWKGYQTLITPKGRETFASRFARSVMSRIKLLKDVVDDIRALSESLGTLADDLETSEPKVLKQEETKPALTLSDVRAVLAKKSQAGFTKEIKVLIHKYGAEKLSAVDPKHYEALLKEVEELEE